MVHPTATSAQQRSGQSLHPALHKLLSKRLGSDEHLTEFLSWDLKQLPNLQQMRDLEKAAIRILQAIENEECIGVFGDYDVDGTTSCALLYHFFKMIDVEIRPFQPGRFDEGYGVHPSSIDMAQEAGVDLLMTVDCGITGHAAATYAKERGIDLIITDHHTAQDELPDAFAVIDPCRQDENPDSQLRTLAGVGVAFALALKIKTLMEAQGKKCPSLYPLLQFVAIGTICDLAKLTPMNLKMVRHGLKSIKENAYPGIAAFFTPEERRRRIIPSEKLSFNIGPLINSKGRLDHPKLALELLTANDRDNTFEMYSQLEICNKDRKQIQRDVFEQAKELVLEKIGDEPPLINVVYHPDWHEGVIGIVASKLVETFKVPAIVMARAKEEGVIKGSARSAGELHLFNLLKDNDDLFLKFGGHKAAAGLSLNEEKLPELIQRLNDQLREVPEIERTRASYYDLELRPEEVNAQLARQLEYLEPFGMGNERPIFKMRGIKLDSYTLMKDVHVRWNFSSLENPKIKLRGVSFNFVGKWGAMHPEELFTRDGGEVSVQFTLGINHFNGNEYVQLMVEEITPGVF